MSWQTFLLYLTTWLLVALTPGPAVMYSMAQTTRHGFRSGLMGIIGIQTGNLLFFVGIATGLAALLAMATTVFAVLRVVGAVYLCYLGLRIIRSTLRRTAKDTRPEPAAVVQSSLFWQGVLIQLTNPKALLFVSALLPQFIDPSRPIFSQLIILSVTTIVVDGVVLSAYALFAERGVRTFKALRFSRWFERAFGALLICFGFRLLLSRD